MVIRGSFYFQIKGLRGTTGASGRGVIFRFETISVCVWIQLDQGGRAAFTTVLEPEPLLPEFPELFMTPLGFESKPET